MAKRKKVDYSLARPNDPEQAKLLTKVKAKMKEMGFTGLSVVEDLRVLAEHDRLVSLMQNMRESADKLEIVTQKISSTSLYKRLRAAEDKRNAKET